MTSSDVHQISIDQPKIGARVNASINCETKTKAIIGFHFSNSATDTQRLLLTFGVFEISKLFYQSFLICFEIALTV